MDAEVSHKHNFFYINCIYTLIHTPHRNRTNTRSDRLAEHSLISLCCDPDDEFAFVRAGNDHVAE